MYSFERVIGEIEILVGVLSVSSLSLTYLASVTRNHCSLVGRQNITFSIVIPILFLNAKNSDIATIHHDFGTDLQNLEDYSPQFVKHLNSLTDEL